MVRRLSLGNVDSAVVIEGRVKIEGKVTLAVLNAASENGDAHAESFGIDDAQEVSCASDSVR